MEELLSIITGVWIIFKTMGQVAVENLMPILQDKFPNMPIEAIGVMTVLLIILAVLLNRYISSKN